MKKHLSGFAAQNSFCPQFQKRSYGLVLCKQTIGNFHTRPAQWRHLSGYRVLFVPHSTRLFARLFEEPGVRCKV